MKKILALILCLCSILPLSGCSKTVMADDLMDGINANAVKSDVDLRDNAQVVDFAVRLFQESEESGKSTLVSPFSVLCALSMTANGADGETLSQMEQTLGMPVSELNEYIHAYTNSLTNGKKRKLSTANSIWFRDSQSFTPNRDFLQTNADYYGADIYKKNFDNTTRDDINAWVKDNTDGMIDKIVDEIPDEAIMYLINAIAFDAEWQKVYKEDQVRDGIFTKADKTEQIVKMMNSTEHVYLQDENAKGFIKNYYGGEYAFAALLPDENISVSDYVKSLTGEKLSKILANRQSTTVYTKTPAFKGDYSYEMADILQKMGMTDAFNAGTADFSKLGKADENIFINRVLHKTHVEVDSKGTKAAAVTAVEMNTRCAAPMDAPEPKEVYLDRPFVYMIIDTNSNFPIFMGTVTEV